MHSLLPGIQQFPCLPARMARGCSPHPQHSNVIPTPAGPPGLGPGLKAHLASGTECCEDAAPACVCQKGSFNTVSQQSCPSSPHGHSGCNTNVLGGSRSCRKLVLALADLHVTVSACLPVCLRAASGEFLGSLQTSTSISTILWAPKALPYRDRVRAKLHLSPVRPPVPVAHQTFPISVDRHPCHIRFLLSGTISSLMPDGKLINMNS